MRNRNDGDSGCGASAISEEQTRRKTTVRGLIEQLTERLKPPRHILNEVLDYFRSPNEGGANDGAKLHRAANYEKDTASDLIALGIALVGVLSVLLAIGVVVVIPIALRFVTPGEPRTASFQTVRWPLLAVFASVGLAAIYRYAPDRDPARWRWVTWGAALPTILWLAASAGFSYYVSNFAHYNKTYGSLGAVAVMMLWLLISAYVVLLGAELDAEMEHQTTVDSTDPPHEPPPHEPSGGVTHLSLTTSPEAS